MIEISIPRIKRYSLILGALGAVTVLLLRNWKEAAGFLVGAALALLTIESWTSIAASLNPVAAVKRSAGASGAFLALRYVLIAAAIYATVKVLGVSPVALLLGLLVSFAAVAIEILQQLSRK
jgi:hypothetical protein